MRGDVILRAPERDYVLTGVDGTRHEAEPWTYERSHPAYARHPYTLLFYQGGFKQRVYDCEGTLAPAKSRTEPS